MIPTMAIPGATGLLCFLFMGSSLPGTAKIYLDAHIEDREICFFLWLNAES
jgi:hypothetical protein